MLGQSRIPRKIAMSVNRVTLARYALAAAAAVSGAALAVEQPVDFGAPTVLSQQGQRLKVVLPVRSAPEDRATAVSFLVRETEVDAGFRTVPPEGFTVMRPARSDYVVLQSADVVTSPRISLVMSVAGDPRSPYRMDLDVPPASASKQSALAGARSAGAHSAGSSGSGQRGLTTRKLRGPVGEANLPDK
jgi:hypothetical protein